jgi:hypothetical protein
VLQFQHHRLPQAIGVGIGAPCDATTHFERRVLVTFLGVSAGLMNQKMTYLVRVLAEAEKARV